MRIAGKHHLNGGEIPYFCQPHLPSKGPQHQLNYMKSNGAGVPPPPSELFVQTEWPGIPSLDPDLTQELYVPHFLE